MEKRTRIGTYGIVHIQDKILLITKKDGPYKGLLDLPGGGIEFAEDPKTALSRELFEEVGMRYKEAQLIENVSWSGECMVDRGPFEEKIHFHHLGMIYEIIEPRIDSDARAEETYNWYEFSKLNQSMISPLAKEAISAFFKKKLSTKI